MKDIQPNGQDPRLFSRELTRRQFIHGAAETAAGLTLVGTGLALPRRAEAAPLLKPEAQGIPTREFGIDGAFWVKGVAQEARNVLTVDVSNQRRGQEVFRNTFPVPETRAWIAEPGVLLYHQADPKSWDLAHKNAQASGTKWDEWLMSAETHDVFERPEAQWRVKEGGWARISTGRGKFTIEETSHKGFEGWLEDDEITHHNLWVRGQFRDGNTPQDRNLTLALTEMMGGHTLAESYPRGAYISEGYFNQLAQDEIAGGGNQNGSEGSRRVFNHYYDTNTRAWHSMVWEAKQPGWKTVFANYRV